jgi:antitoxin MazE
MKSVIRKIGNSHGVAIPRELLAKIGAKAGDEVDLVVEDGKLVISAQRQIPRTGWAADSKRLVEAGEAGPAWPEFANDGDHDLKW